MTYLLDADEPVVIEAPDTSELEAEFLHAIKSWEELQDTVIPERLTHVKVRKHTRHWEGDGAGDKALDPQYAVEVRRWQRDIIEAMGHIMRTGARKAAQAAAREMVQTGIASAMHARGLGNPKARSALGRVFGSTEQVDRSLAGFLDPLEAMVTEAAKRHSERVAETIRQMDADGASLGQIQRAVRDAIGARSSWREQLARYLTTAVTEGGKEAAYSKAGILVTKTWHTREDERVRTSHRRLEGREIPVHRRFRVGKYWMLRPLDPAGGIEETVNCRCWLSYDINPEQAEFYYEHAG